MGSQWGRDKVYLRARQEGFRSRAAYKLIEIQRRFNVIRKSDNVIDLGAAPGSWLQVVRGLTDGRILGIDLSPIPPLENTDTMVGDITDSEVMEKAKDFLGVVSVVISDASPKLSGHKSYDQARAIALGTESLHFACSVLKPGGNFVVKSFQGTDFSGLFNEVRQHFHSVRACDVQATRKGSTEIYIVAKNFMG